MASCACHADWPIGGGHTAVVTEPGVLYTFGAGAEGQLGHRDRSAGSFPTALCIHGERVLMAACGAYHSACCTDTGKVFTWGSGRWGTLGQGDESDRLEPSRVDFESEGASGHGPQRVVQVSCGARHTAAVTELGDLWIWGMHSLGQLGLGSLGEVAGSFARPVMLRVQALERHHVAMVACGGFHTLAADSGGSLFAWGLGRSGQLGLGDSRSHPVPQRVDPKLFGGGIVFVAAGSAHSGAVTVGGQLYMWGCGRDGRLGVRTNGLPESGMDQVFSMSVFDAKNSACTHTLCPLGCTRTHYVLLLIAMQHRYPLFGCTFGAGLVKWTKRDRPTRQSQRREATSMETTEPMRWRYRWWLPVADTASQLREEGACGCGGTGLMASLDCRMPAGR